MSDKDFYSDEEAAQCALEWCANHPGWKRLCDLPDVGMAYQSFDEQRDTVKEHWNARGGERAWIASGIRPFRYPVAYISGQGRVYRTIYAVPMHHNAHIVIQSSKPKR